MNDYPLESFVFYRSFRDAISEMSDENKLATLLAICDYALYGVEPKLKDAMARAVFTVARPSIDANKGRRANGKKGGRPPKKPMVSDFENQWISKSESTETETETVSEAETDTGANGAGKPPARFRPPSVEDVKMYCDKKGYHVDAESFVAFYASKGWYIGKNKMKNWKQALITWEKRGESHGNIQQRTIERRPGDDRDWTAGFHAPDT